MKKTVLTILISTSLLFACNQTDKKSNQTTVESSNVEQKISSPLLANYLQIEDALVKDDGNVAAKAGQELAVILKSFDVSKLNENQKSAFSKIKDDAIENAEHIGENAENIKHQREHFKMLSEDMYTMAKYVDTTQKLYKINCPMYKNGSYWLSTTEEVKNPFYGSKMSSCGSVNETIN